MTVTMRREEATAIFPEPRPYFSRVGLWNFQMRESFTLEELKTSFSMLGWNSLQLSLYFKQEHEPMTLALVAMFADQAGEMQV